MQDHEEVYRFYDANRDLPVDYISFRPVESTAGDFYNHEYAEKDINQSIEAIKKLKQEDERVTLNFKWEMLDRQEDRCTAQWAQIAVNEHGEVMYCCHKPYQIVGHVMDEDILEKKRAAYTDMGAVRHPVQNDSAEYVCCTDGKGEKGCVFYLSAWRDSRTERW